MQWAPEAEAALARVPFFVRRKVRARVEEEAAALGRPQVTRDALQETQRRYLSGMSAEVRGYRVETCFGPGGCPNRAIASDTLLPRIEALLQAADLLPFLKERVKGPLRFHHEFRVALADCPNACSQPQIRDVGIVGAQFPRCDAALCSGCSACEEVCHEQAIRIDPPAAVLHVLTERCLGCGRCVAACPTGALAAGERGFRVLLGGKLGRHPRLAHELPGVFDTDRTIAILEACLALYKSRSRHGERFSEILTVDDCNALADRHRR